MMLDESDQEAQQREESKESNRHRRKKKKLGAGQPVNYQKRNKTRRIKKTKPQRRHRHRQYDQFEIEPASVTERIILEPNPRLLNRRPALNPNAHILIDQEHSVYGAFTLVANTPPLIFNQPNGKVKKQPVMGTFSAYPASLADRMIDRDPTLPAWRSCFPQRMNNGIDASTIWVRRHPWFTGLITTLFWITTITGVVADEPWGETVERMALALAEQIFYRDDEGIIDAQAQFWESIVDLGAQGGSVFFGLLLYLASMLAVYRWQKLPQKRHGRPDEWPVAHIDPERVPLFAKKISDFDDDGKPYVVFEGEYYIFKNSDIYEKAEAREAEGEQRYQRINQVPEPLLGNIGAVSDYCQQRLRGLLSGYEDAEGHLVLSNFISALQHAAHESGSRAAEHAQLIGPAVQSFVAELRAYESTTSAAPLPVVYKAMATGLMAIPHDYTFDDLIAGLAQFLEHPNTVDDPHLRAAAIVAVHALMNILTALKNAELVNHDRSADSSDSSESTSFADLFDATHDDLDDFLQEQKLRLAAHLEQSVQDSMQYLHEAAANVARELPRALAGDSPPVKPPVEPRQEQSSLFARFFGGTQAQGSASEQQELLNSSASSLKYGSIDSE